MKVRTFLLFASYAALTACGDTATPAPATDASADAPTDTVAPDGALDAAPDRPTVDASAPDATPADAPPADAPADRGTADVTTDASGCNGDAPACVSGTAGGTCGDVVTPASCVGSAWRCGDPRSGL